MPTKQQQKQAEREKHSTTPDNMPTHILECYVDGHWWERTGSDEVTYGPRKKALEIAYRNACARCPRKRKTKRGRDLRVISRSYSSNKEVRMDMTNYKGMTPRYAALLVLQRRRGVPLD